MQVFSVKHKPTVHGLITGHHAGITFGHEELAERYAELVGGEVEERETADISSCRIFEHPDYLANTHALLDNWEAQMPKPEPKPEPAQRAPSPAAAAAIAQRAAAANKR